MSYQLFPRRTCRNSTRLAGHQDPSVQVIPRLVQTESLAISHYHFRFSSPGSGFHRCLYMQVLTLTGLILCICPSLQFGGHCFLLPPLFSYTARRRAVDHFCLINVLLVIWMEQQLLSIIPASLQSLAFD